jgi:hypothetical protein
MSIRRFVGGKIMEAWDNWDQLAVMTQLGVVSLENIASGAKPPQRASLKISHATTRYFSSDHHAVLS